MKDKRIKLIAEEMFIAWGLICALFLILDMFYWRSGIVAVSPGTSASRELSRFGVMVFSLVDLSNLPAMFASYLLINMLSFLHFSHAISMTIGILLFVVIQILFWGYLGDITGRFIVWLKSLLPFSLWNFKRHNHKEDTKHTK